MLAGSGSQVNWRTSDYEMQFSQSSFGMASQSDGMFGPKKYDWCELTWVLIWETVTFFSLCAPT